MKIIETVGNTPLVQLSMGGGRIYAKLEKNNPAMSIKDRVARAMIEDAIERGALKPGMKIVEPTSGNTGIALAMIGKQLGYPATIVMPASMSEERKKLIRSFGAELLLVKEGGMQAAVDKAKELAESGAYFMADQFNNPANPRTHEEITGPEILKALDAIDAFVAGIGTGGTVTGVGRALKAHKKNTLIVGLEPAESPLLSAGKAGGHKIQGIGANFVPGNYDPEVVDRILTVEGDAAIAMAKKLAAEEGLSVGISAGANVVGALRLAEEVKGNVVTVLPDAAERYMSTELFG
ncbi:cysteine synthase A [Peptoniphilus ivorii]|uniref:cysteine synthase A n=1 Tax=Aedoeadaptatus ivorii TaxID=54006 RepID=UPI0027847A44|nr:cysteine synthase A [Peptoniphilus ivorii]MDQ0508352.1 cysteine synthase A [Peptoniphilus ivorii]